MFLDDFYQARQTSDTSQAFRVQPDQASRFAKHIAADFNPLHNADSKRFCVPGDLMFAISLAQFGLAKTMAFKFVGMLTDDREFSFGPQANDHYAVQDQDGKILLTMQHHQLLSQRPEVITPFIQAYVAFSGESFPNLLVPIMAEHNIMINPERPMVMYESMAVRFTATPTQQTRLTFTGYDIEPNGKRAQVALKFAIHNEDGVIGNGHKTMLLSGLRAYDPQAMQEVCDRYAQVKKDYAA